MSDDSEKALRTYAYLTAYLRTDASVADVYDCLLPFLTDSIARRPKEPVSIDKIASDLTSIGLEIPMYALQQMLPRLATRGVVEWNAVSHSFIPVAGLTVDKSQFPELPESFAEIEPMLAEYASKLGVSEPPVGDTWADALISFLRSSYKGKNIKAFKFHETLVANAPERQEYIVASFLSKLAAEQPSQFEHVVRIYTGVQIEDFISNIQTLQRSVDFRRLNVFYDTSVILRLLGTSGELHRDATLEMHHSLQSLGAKTHILGGTSTEVENILSTVVGAYDRGQEIYHETADALLNGEISIGEIRDFSATYEARLATLNIFPYDYNYQTNKADDYFQIDEDAFASALQSGALIAERTYSAHNAHNDAHAVAIVLRLRKGRSERDIGRSWAIFITKNRLLQRVARQFAIEHTEFYDESSVPPVFTEGQITMAAWLGNGKGLSAAKVTKELLARCYSAVQPSAEWVDAFAAAIAEFQSEEPDAVTQRANAIIFLRTARNAARDASLNDATVLKRLNIAQLFRQAEEAARAEEERRQEHEDAAKRGHANKVAELERAHEEKIEGMRAELDAKYQLELDEQITRAREQALAEERNEREAKRHKIASRVAAGIVACAYILIVLASSWVLIFGIGYEFDSPLAHIAIAVLAVLITVLALLDLGGFGLVRRAIDRIRLALANAIERILAFIGA
ncbi:MAG: hypothetical protein ACTHN4_02920 [Sphingomicrobium sp.]